MSGRDRKLSARVHLSGQRERKRHSLFCRMLPCFLSGRLSMLIDHTRLIDHGKSSKAQIYPNSVVCSLHTSILRPASPWIVCFALPFELALSNPFFASARLQVGGQADSGHEYLLKQYLLTNKTDKPLLEMCMRPPSFSD
jgi:hypothetical protein